jgi:hypothetical protein
MLNAVTSWASSAAVEVNRQDAEVAKLRTDFIDVFGLARSYWQRGRFAYNHALVAPIVDASPRSLDGLRPTHGHRGTWQGSGVFGGGFRHWFAVWLTCAATAACSAEDDGGGAGSVGAAGSSEAPASEDSSGEAGGRAFAEPVCAPSPGLDSPQSIAGAVAWINALPKPLSLPCFLETLPRPLELYASESIFSAQPAVGSRSPRMFVFADALIMTIVADGVGSHLLEFGERRFDVKSLKGEIPFPVTAELTPAAPFEHLIIDDRFTSCALCHAEEEPDPDTSFTRAFLSRALRPVPAERVSLEELRAEAIDCDGGAEPERCAMLVALFGQGNVLDAEFPTELGTFY